MSLSLSKEGTSAYAGPHYQKLYGRVTHVWSNRRGQPKRSAMQEPRPGRSPFVIRFTSPSGKYELQSVRCLCTLVSVIKCMWFLLMKKYSLLQNTEMWKWEALRQWMYFYCLNAFFIEIFVISSSVHSLMRKIQLAGCRDSHWDALTGEMRLRSKFTIFFHEFFNFKTSN